MSKKSIQDYYPDDVAQCYGCGKANEHGLQLKSYWEGDETVAVVHPRSYHMAIPGYVYGGLIASKPYIASANYINRMSDYCAGCRYDPSEALKDGACPFTTLYWDFLSRNRNRLDTNPRMKLQFRNLDRMDSQTAGTDDQHPFAGTQFEAAVLAPAIQQPRPREQ